jgi:hypothetical protein
MHPEIIGIEDEGAGITRSSERKGAPWEGVGSGDTATVSVSATLVSTSVGAITRRSVVSSFMMARYVGIEEDSLSPSMDRRKKEINFLQRRYNEGHRYPRGV